MRESTFRCDEASSTLGRYKMNASDGNIGSVTDFLLQWAQVQQLPFVLWERDCPGWSPDNR